MFAGVPVDGAESASIRARRYLSGKPTTRQMEDRIGSESPRTRQVDASYFINRQPGNVTLLSSVQRWDLVPLPLPPAPVLQV